MAPADAGAVGTGIWAVATAAVRRMIAKGVVRMTPIVTLLSVLRIDLRCLFADSPRIDDEFEGIGVLILFHQLQIGEPLGTLDRIAAGKLRLRRFEQIRCHLILAVCGKMVGGS